MSLSNQTSRTAKHAEVVEKIMTLLKNKGPTLPIHIATETGLSMIFANAFLSELISQKIVRISNMRIGSSPLYYLPGQEEQLLNHEQHIKGKEREAYEYLKNEGVLRDEELEPAIRVALRNIKDFAHPLQANHEGQAIIFWRFITIKDEEAKERIRKMFTPARETINQQQTTITHKKETEKAKKEEAETEQQKKEKKAVMRTSEESEFTKEIKNYLAANGFEIIKELETKKKDAMMIIKTKAPIGEIEILAVCKDKKKISEVDLTIALQRAQTEKLPCIYITPGELNKKGEEYIKQWKNLLFYRRINLKNHNIKV